MKKLMVSFCAAASLVAFAKEVQQNNVEQSKESEVLEKQSAPLFWGFGNYGIYSGYQLYGSLLNNEPTAQGYLEGNLNLLFADWDLGYLGAGIWSNSDLTPRRDHIGIGGAFNEWDFNVHWGRTFWFDDAKTWGLTYRASVVWYYYPGQHYQRIHPACDTTMDFNHYFELANPYAIPYVNVVREYRFDANLFQFGVKKPFQITDQWSICPFLEMVARDGHYNWCFPTQFGWLSNKAGQRSSGDGCTSGGLATLKVELDTTYMFNDRIGVFGKIAYCSIIDHHMRNDCDDILNSDDYGENKDFVWGGVGVCVNF